VTAKSVPPITTYEKSLNKQVLRDLPWLTDDEVRRAVAAIFDNIVEALARGESARIERFASFEPVWIKPRERWISTRRRMEAYDGFMSIRFYQAPIWSEKPGFEYPNIVEMRRRDKQRRDATAYLKTLRKKKKPR